MLSRKRFSIQTTLRGKLREPLIVKREDGVYLSMGLVLNYTKVRIQAFDSTDIKRVFIENDWDGTPTADVRGRVKVRVEADVKSPILTECYRGDSVTVLETTDEWVKIATADGHIGYVKTESLRICAPWCRKLTLRSRNTKIFLWMKRSCLHSTR